MGTLGAGTLPRGRRVTYWLIFEHGPESREPLTLGTFPEEQALAVFSFLEEALLFLSVQGIAESWTVTEVYADELVSVLLRSCLAHVALDPLPGPLGRVMVGLLSIERERFPSDLLRKRWPVASLPSYVAWCGGTDNA